MFINFIAQLIEVVSDHKILHESDLVCINLCSYRLYKHSFLFF